MFRLKYADEKLVKKTFDINRGLCFYCKKFCDENNFWMISEEDLVIIDDRNIEAIAICHPECHKNAQIEKIRKEKKLLFDITAYPIALYLIGILLIIISLIKFFLVNKLEMLTIFIGAIISMTGWRIWMDNKSFNKKNSEKLKDVDKYY
jgi:Pyruvate/2-oxoacid:ferredoxin oxidoreductase delta subunit